jgi:hypothetical protein
VREHRRRKRRHISRQGEKEGVLDAAWLKIKLTIFRDWARRGRGGEARDDGAQTSPRKAQVHAPLRDGVPVQCSKDGASVEVPHPSSYSIII